jgi:serine/threonine protein kinase
MSETVLFGRYRLIERAGSGGSAAVWRAIDTQSGDEVAVKRLHPVVFADAAGQARLRREFAALRELDDPHVVRVRDLEIDGSDAALILDFVDGPSLADRLAAGSPFRADEAIDIATDIAAALAAAHAAGIVHRDVTPGNILLDPNDGARLTDFGIALGAGADTAVTAAGQVMGTLKYLAPEQLRGAAATPSSDLHGLAAVTYEMLAGRPAYAAATPVELAEVQARGPEPIAGTPPAVDAIVRRGLAADPADRPRDVATFAAELKAAFEGDETQPIVPLADGSPAPAPEPMVPPAAVLQRRARALPLPLMALLALVISGIVLAAVAPPGGDIAERPSQELAAPARTPTATPEPTATPTPEPKDDDKENDKGDKGGDGKGKGHKGGDH